MRIPTRLTASLAATALALGAGLVSAAPGAAESSSPAVSASPAAAFDSLTISGLKKKHTLPKSGKTRTVTFTVNVAGAPSNEDVEYKPYDAEYSSAKVVQIKSKVKSSSLPRLLSPATLDPGANAYQLQIPSYVAPGIYEVRIPVTQNDWTTGSRVPTTKTVTKRFQVHATKKISKKSTSFFAPSWRDGATAKFTFRAPEYQKGAKVTLYYKKASAKKYTKIVTKKLKVKKGAYNSQAILKTKKLYPGHKIYFKVGKTKWAPGYKTKAVKIVRR